MVAELILHHYDFSNYSEKVRLVLGLKGLSWRSVEIPPVLPKPDYLPLTGGYRRAPALQIGAEVYCDTVRITEELERRFPQPSLYPGPDVAAQRACIAGLERSPPPPSEPFDGDPALGQTVAVTPTDYGKANPSIGTLVSIDAVRLALQHSHARTGLVTVHFPRFGYQLRQIST